MLLNPVYRWFIIGLISAICFFLCFHPIQESEFGRASDEGHYLKYATAVVHNGKSSFHDLINWYAHSPGAFKHPAPVRAGYILLGALLFKLFGSCSFTALALISTLSFFLFLYVCFYYVRRYFDLDTALLTSLLLASSPLILGLSRRALIDGPANLLWAMAVWFFLDVLMRPAAFSYICFLASLTVAISFKESSLILIPFFMIVGACSRSWGGRINLSQIWGILIFPLIVILLFYSWIYGGAGTLMDAAAAILKTHFSSQELSPYAVNYCSGPWFKYLLDFLLLVPIELLLFIGYIFYLGTQRDKVDFKRGYLAFYFIYVYTVLSIPAHTKVVRFVVNLEMVIALFAVLMLVELLKGLDEARQRFYLFYACFGIFLTNLSAFMVMIYSTSLLDPISFTLLYFRHIIPF